MPEIGDDMLTLVDEEGEEHNFFVLEILEVDGKSYAVLAPEDDDEDMDDLDDDPDDDEDDEDGSDAFIFRIEMKDGDEQLVTVDDEEEFDRVAAALAELETWDDTDDEELEDD
jgi:uncharacterized protein YrzB (UPF0473 family)